MCDLNAQYHLIWELMLYKFELGYNNMEATKNICRAKGEGTDDHSITTRWIKKFYSSCKNLNNQTRSDSSKSMDSKAVKQNLVSSTQRVSGEFGISKSSVVCHLHDFGKSSQRCGIVLHITNILQNFWLSLDIGKNLSFSLSTKYSMNTNWS